MSLFELDDDSPMPFGKEFKGTPLGEVPAWYLLGLLSSKNLDANLEKYILDNEQALLKEKEDERYKRF